MYIRRTDAEAETPMPPDAKNWLIWNDPDARKDWRQEEKGMTEDEMVGWHHRLDGHESEGFESWWWAGKPGVLQSMASQRVGRDWVTELNWKPNLHQKQTKKGHGHCLVICASLIHYSFRNLSETITSEKYAQQISVLPWKLQCLPLAFVNRKSLILHDNQRFKSWMNRATKFCLICCIHQNSCQPAAISWNISTTCCREIASTNSRKQKNAF